MNLELHATPTEVMRAVEALEKFVRTQGLPEKAVFSLKLALEECASNIVDHGLQRDALQTFQVAFNQTGQSITIELRDHGPHFDLTAAPQRHQKFNGDDALGGWGIQLVRRYMDEIRYRREGEENVLQLIKHVGHGTEPEINNQPKPN